jgi:hypothetical protein
MVGILQSSEIGGTFFGKAIPLKPLQKTATLAGILISQREIGIPAKARSS